MFIVIQTPIITNRSNKITMQSKITNDKWTNEAFG